MKTLFTQQEFENAKSKDLLAIECCFCSNKFYKTKHYIQGCLNPNAKRTGKYCSVKCNNDSRKTIKNVKCNNCGVLFLKLPNQIKRSLNSFCSRSCSTVYNNKNKTYGIRRSKLESWLEERLTNMYPEIIFEFNKKNIINSELDIYIPSLNVAFEINGIFHYEPIFGVDKLNSIKENDKLKIKLCHNAKIDLYTIDVSSQKYFKPKTSQKYLDIVINIIEEAKKPHIL